VAPEDIETPEQRARRRAPAWYVDGSQLEDRKTQEYLREERRLDEGDERRQQPAST